jgi:predicted RNase H-like nuclease (RuvC/YqgF family)
MPDLQTLVNVGTTAAGLIGTLAAGVTRRRANAEAARARIAVAEANARAAEAEARASVEAADLSGRHAVSAEEARMAPKLLARIDRLERRLELQDERCTRDLAERDRRIDGLDDTVHGLTKKCAEQDQKIRSLERENAELRQAVAAAASPS